jgi:hypothetical protein
MTTRPTLTYTISGLTEEEYGRFYIPVMCVSHLVKGLEQNGDTVTVGLDMALVGQTLSIKKLEEKVRRAISESLDTARSIELVSAG